MTTGGFGSLFYTDCKPGQGLRGSGGFQFQAVSDGVGHEQQALVQRSALYEVPVAWMREHRAVTNYPPSLAHVHDDGCYVTARGVYLGAEANGVREGNQFTHAVSTADAGTYGLVRPAQLWNAPWWAEEPATTTRCEPVPGQPERGQWGIDAVREWVLGRPDAADWLLAVASALDRIGTPDGRRLVFVAEDPASILGWLSAGTLLLPQERALRIGFRVFTTNPQYSRHDVLGVHPDWAGSLAQPGRSQDFLVFNVDTGAHAAIEPTEAAAFWVRWFLEADPFDVIEAVELAHGFARATTTPDAAEVRAGDGDRIAGAVLMLDAEVNGAAEADALGGWLAAQRTAVEGDVLGAVTAALLAGPADATALRELDRLVARQGVAEHAERVRSALLAAELADAVRGPVEPALPLPELKWSDAGQMAAADLVERSARETPPERLDGVLRLAVRFAVPALPLNFPDAAQRFVAWWADHPETRLDPRGWPLGDVLVDLLRDELRGRPDGDAVDAAVHGLWPLLLPVTDLGTPLDLTVAAAAFAHGSCRLRQETRDIVLSLTRASHQPDAGDRGWAALFTYRQPDPADVSALLAHVRRDTASGTFLDRAATVLARAAGGPIDVSLLQALDRVEALGGALSPGLARLCAQDRELRRWLAAAADPLRGGSSALRGLGREVLLARRDEVLEALLALTPSHAARVVVDAGPEVQEFVLSGLYTYWRSGGVVHAAGVETTAVAVTFQVVAEEPVPRALVDKFTMLVRKWVKEAPRDLVREVGATFTDDPEMRERWHGITGASAPRPPKARPEPDRDGRRLADRADRGERAAREPAPDRGPGRLSKVTGMFGRKRDGS